MSQTTHKHRLVAQVFTSVKTRASSDETPPRPVLEQFLYAVCRDGTTRDKADRAFRNLSEKFFDWNEVRVSSPREVEEALAELPDPEARAQRIIALLQEVFETTFSFDLEPLAKKGIKPAAKQLGRFQAANDFALAWVTQHALGGHAVALDAPALRVARRLGLVEENVDDYEALLAALEPLVPKAKASQFADVLSELAEQLCTEDSPQCSACRLCVECPTGQERVRPAAARAGRAKPR